MKYLFSISIILLALLSCKAQSPIVSRDASFQGKTPGTYFKDLDGEFNKFNGTWIYSNGGTSLTIELVKKTMIFYNSNGYYFDDLFGEYKYAENNNTILNTLPTLQQNPDDYDSRNIGGGHIIPTNLYVACENCSPNERRVKLYFNDPERSYLSVSIVLRYIVGSSPAQMRATIFSGGGGMLPDANSPTAPRVPYGEYLMTKQ